MKNLMQAQFNFKCHCLEEFKVTCRKPGLVRPTIASVECPGCESQYTLRVVMAQEPRSHKVNVHTNKFKPSEELTTVLAEEAEYRHQQAVAAKAVECAR
jgi:hypothetical protein